MSTLAAVTTPSDKVKDWRLINVAVDNWANEVDRQLSRHFETETSHDHTHLQEAVVKIQKHFVLTISERLPKTSL